MLTRWWRCSRVSAPSCQRLTLSSTEPVSRMLELGAHATVHRESSWAFSNFCRSDSRIVVRW